MLKNNIEVDVKVKCIEAGITQAKLAEQVETTPSYVNRLIKKQEYSGSVVKTKNQEIIVNQIFTYF